MNYTKSRAFAALIAALAVVAGAAGPAMAATPTVDTINDADSTTTSDWTNGHTVVGFNASASNHSWVEVSFDAALAGQARLRILDPDTGTKVADMETVYRNSSAQQTNATTNNYAWNISHDELRKLPIEANQNKTFTVEIADTGDTANATTMNVHFDNTEERTVIRVGETETGDDGDATIEQLNPRLSNFFDTFDQEKATLEKDDVAVDGQNTTTYVYFANDSFAEAYASAAEEQDDGAWLPMMTLSINGDLAPTFNGESADWDYLDENAYGVYDADEEWIVIEANEDEDLEDETQVDIMTSGNENMGFWTAQSMFRSLGAGWFDAVSNSVQAANAPVV